MNRGNRGSGSWVAWLIIGFFLLNAMTSMGGMAIPLFTVFTIFAVVFGVWALANGINALNLPRSQRAREADAQAQRERHEWRVRARLAEDDEGDDEDDDDGASLDLPRPYGAQANTPKAVANRALQRAGNRPDSWLLGLDDIGILAYHGDTTPDVKRLDAIAPDATHLRPFAVINLPYRQGRGPIRFELYDETGDKRFESQNIYQLKRGPNFITSSTWLPLPENRGSGRWTMRVSIGDKPLAVHEFNVRAEYTGAMRSFLREDGEIDPWLSKAIAEQDRSGNSMSLDDLLASQYDVDEMAAENRLR